ncbi:MAG: hypothetical protein WC560_05000 [Syntrophales bacterium]
MKRLQNIVAIWLFVISLGACTHTSPLPDNRVYPPVGEKAVIQKTETALFNEGLFYLGSPDHEADYTKAIAAFDALLKMHPESERRSLVEVLLRFIDETQLCKAKNVSDQQLIEKADADREKLREANEQFKKELRSLGDKSQAEMAKLREENEQLKKDIQLLKNLEIQLDTREKRLR